MGDARETDASGNPILKDSGIWLRDSIKKRFKDADIKYIDPSYLIRSIPTTSNDRIYCKVCCSVCRRGVVLRGLQKQQHELLCHPAWPHSLHVGHLESARYLPGLLMHGRAAQPAVPQSFPDLLEASWTSGQLSCAVAGNFAPAASLCGLCNRATQHRPNGGHLRPLATAPLPVQVLAHNAVHAAFAGFTGVTVGLVNTHYVYLPIPIVIQAPRKVTPAFTRVCLHLAAATRSVHSQLHSQQLLVRQHGARGAPAAGNAWMPVGGEGSHQCSGAWSSRLRDSGTISGRMSHDTSAGLMIMWSRPLVSCPRAGGPQGQDVEQAPVFHWAAKLCSMTLQSLRLASWQTCQHITD